MPSMPGIFRSVSSRSGVKSSSLGSALKPSAAVSTEYPSSRSSSASAVRALTSSSTIRIRPRGVMAVRSSAKDMPALVACALGEVRGCEDLLDWAHDHSLCASARFGAPGIPPGVHRRLPSMLRPCQRRSARPARTGRASLDDRTERDAAHRRADASPSRSAAAQHATLAARARADDRVAGVGPRAVEPSHARAAHRTAEHVAAS